MARWGIVFISISTAVLAQSHASDSATLRHWLSDGTPREAAWAAFYAGQNAHRDLIPQLAARLEAYRSPSTEEYPVPPEDALVQAVADALIRLNASIPAQTVMHLYPRFPALTVILLARAQDAQQPLLDIFQNTRHRDLWLAAGNLLAANPPAGFVHALLQPFFVSFVFRVVEPAGKAVNDGGGGGCAADMYMVADERFRDWPRIREYDLETDATQQNIFAPGVHPVAYGGWNTTNYVDNWTSGDCMPSSGRQWRLGLIAQVTGNNLPDFALQRDVVGVIRFENVRAFADQVQAAIEAQTRVFEQIIDSSIGKGILASEDAAELKLKCTLDIHDQRPVQNPPLPNLQGQFCVTPAAADLASDPPK